jgi:hypothetical protein
MTARRVHAVLAAGVHSPNLIVRWQKDPQFLLRQGIRPESIDLTALWKFAGLPVKVRHNPIRRQLPITFRFMSVAGLEIEVFASYATFCAANGRRYAATSEERANDLIGFLEQWLDFSNTTHLILWDLVRHEHALARLTRSTIPVVTADRVRASKQRPTATSVPVVLGKIILHQMRGDPRSLESILFQRAPKLSNIALGSHYYCYWRSDQLPEVKILELDEFGYYVLSFIDGVRSTRELSNQLGGGSRPSRGFLQSLRQLATVGIIDFKPVSKTETR